MQFKITWKRENFFTRHGFEDSGVNRRQAGRRQGCIIHKVRETIDDACQVKIRVLGPEFAR